MAAPRGPKTNWLRLLLLRLCDFIVIAGPVSGLGFAFAAAVPYVTGVAPRCGQGDCDRIAFDPSAFWFGVPVSYCGVVYYLISLALAFAMLRTGLLKWVIAGSIWALLGLVGSKILTLRLQLELNAFCQECTGSALCCVLTGVSFSVRLIHLSDPKVRSSWTVLSCGMVSGLFIAVPTVSRSLDRFHSFAIERTEITKKLRDVPETSLTKSLHRFGPSSAREKVVIWVDFLCTPCHRQLEILLRRQLAGEQFEIILRHRPSQLSAMSMLAANLSESAATNASFLLFFRNCAKIKHLSTRELTNTAVAAGVSIRPFLAQESQVSADIEVANRIGIRTVPTLVVVRSGVPPISVSALPRQN